MDEFRIRVLDHVHWRGQIPPEDPLGELTELELGLKRFCYQENRRISVDVDGDHVVIFLYPDISSMLDRLPSIIAGFSHGAQGLLSFPESYVQLELIPQLPNGLCTITRFTPTITTDSYRIEWNQMIDELQWFISKLVDEAVAGGYIRRDDAREYLAVLS